MAQSNTPMSEETKKLIEKAKFQSFNCRFISLLHIHNYLMFLRDKSVSSINDKNQLVLIDIRGESQAEYHDEHRIFMSTWFDMRKFGQKV